MIRILNCFYCLLFVFFFLSLKTCFDWFRKGQLDLEPDTQSQMFANKVLKLEPGRLTMKGAAKFRYIIVAFVYIFLFTLTVNAISKKNGLYTSINGCILIPSDNSNYYFPLNSSPIIIIYKLGNLCHQRLVGVQ